MAKRLFLLDGMALVYRAHFALIARPILTSKGVNTSALFGFTQTLLEIITKQEPTHLAVAFDTAAPTKRHLEFKDYKANRQEMPEDLSAALPHVRRLLEAFRIPVLTCDGYEADDIIGTLVGAAKDQGFTSYMVTPDKDFGQLVTDQIFLFKPGRMGDPSEVMGLPEIQARWGIKTPDQVIDILALMGDSVDNIPGVPGIGEKTAIKLISQFGTVEGVLEHLADLTPKLRESLDKNRDLAFLSKRLARIDCDSPCLVDLESLRLQSRDDEALKSLLIEFEFNSLGRRLYGDDFRAGRGFGANPGAASLGNQRGDQKSPDASTSMAEPDLFDTKPEDLTEPRPSANLQSIQTVPHEYAVLQTNAERATLLGQLRSLPEFAFVAQASAGDPKTAVLRGLAFSFSEHKGVYVPLPFGKEGAAILEEFRDLLQSEKHGKIGHDLKRSVSILRWNGLEVRGTLFDTMVAHSLVEPEMRHSLHYVSEVYLGYTPMAPKAEASAVGQTGMLGLEAATLDDTGICAIETADLSWQLRQVLLPLLEQRGQHQVFFDIESRLLPVLVDMEHEGIRLDADALGEFAAQLAHDIQQQENAIWQLAGTNFNLNSPRQLGQILFETLKIADAPKKTRTGQYATDEQSLAALAVDHEIVQRLLDHRAATKLKTTYADALPLTIWPRTGRIHTTFNQVATTTGRLNSQDPNLQNIPIRTDRGQEIRRAFVPRDSDHLLMSADYSQIELRIIAALSHEEGLLEAFRTGADVHTATAARIFGTPPADVTPEMRRKAKMVNYGIAYGISAFGLAQRLRIPRKEASRIIDQYFGQFGGIRNYMESTIVFARQHGYVETVTGRRRYLRDIRSANATTRSAAERNAINMPIQGTAADMIKLAMVHIGSELRARNLKSRMLLQVHDELVFDVFRPEETQMRSLVEEKMRTAIPLDVPIVVEIGVGNNWLEAH